MLASLLHTYRTKHHGSDGQLPQEREFEANDAAVALLKIQPGVPLERPIVLMEDGRELATMRLAPEGYWTVYSSAEP